MNASVKRYCRKEEEKGNHHSCHSDNMMHDAECSSNSMEAGVQMRGHGALVQQEKETATLGSSNRPFWSRVSGAGKEWQT